MTIREKECTVFVSGTAGMRSTGVKYQVLPIIFVVLVVLSIVHSDGAPNQEFAVVHTDGRAGYTPSSLICPKT
jgi:hypothetical protein